MVFIIYDLEFTAWEGSQERRWGLEWEHREIIQIEAKKVKLKNDKIIMVDSMSLYISPLINKILSKYIMDLTGITQEKVDFGIHIDELLKLFEDFTENGSIPALSWGNDMSIINENYEISKRDKIEYSNLDLRNLFKECGFGHVLNTNSGNLIKKFDDTVEINEHDASEDVRSLIMSIEKILPDNKEKVNVYFKNLLNT